MNLHVDANHFLNPDEGGELLRRHSEIEPDLSDNRYKFTGSAKNRRVHITAYTIHLWLPVVTNPHCFGTYRMAGYGSLPYIGSLILFGERKRLP